MTHGILTLLILTCRDNDESTKKCCFSSACCQRVQFQRIDNCPLQVKCGQTHLLWRTAFRFDWKASFGNFFLSIVSVLNMFLFDIWGICAMISSIKVASIKPEVSELFLCLLISLRLSDSDKNFLTLRMTVVLLFFFLGFFLCSSLTMCLFRLKAELNVLEHSLHRCLSATLTFFSLTKVPKQQLISPFLLDFHFLMIFSRVYHIHTLMYVWFHIYHSSKIISPCQASVCAPASYVCRHLTWLHFRKGIFHICAFSGF